MPKKKAVDDMGLGIPTVRSSRPKTVSVEPTDFKDSPRNTNYIPSLRREASKSKAVKSRKIIDADALVPVLQPFFNKEMAGPNPAVPTPKEMETGYIAPDNKPSLLSEML